MVCVSSHEDTPPFTQLEARFTPGLLSLWRYVGRLCAASERPLGPSACATSARGESPPRERPAPAAASKDQAPAGTKARRRRTKPPPSLAGRLSTGAAWSWTCRIWR